MKEEDEENMTKYMKYYLIANPKNVPSVRHAILYPFLIISFMKIPF